jgi:hypothetical protein
MVVGGKTILEWILQKMGAVKIMLVYVSGFREHITPTTCPFCWAERVSRMEKTPPPTETSRHRPDFASPPQKEPCGCMMRTPFVVRLSISWFSCHFVALSYKEQVTVTHTTCARTLLQSVIQFSSTPEFVPAHNSSSLSWWTRITSLSGIRKYINIFTKSLYWGLIYSWTSKQKRLHHTLCRQPCEWRILCLQWGIPYEVSRDRHS